MAQQHQWIVDGNNTVISQLIVNPGMSKTSLYLPCHLCCRMWWQWSVRNWEYI